MRRLLKRWRLRGKTCDELACWPTPRCTKPATWSMKNLGGARLYYCDDHGLWMSFAKIDIEAAWARHEKPDMDGIITKAQRDEKLFSRTSHEGDGS